MPGKLKKVFIADVCDPGCAKVLEKNGIQVTYKPKLPLNQLLEEIKDYDGLIVRSATKVTPEVLKAAQKLKIIGRAGTGVDNIDVPAATQQKIIVMNTPGGNTISAAEHTCAMILALSREIPQAAQSLKDGKWERSKFMGHEVEGKTLAIIGLGKIGREVAHRMQAFGLKTIGYDPLVNAQQSKEWGIEYKQLEQIWPEADIITVHVPLIPQTKDLLNKETLAKCKKGAYIINVARGGIVNEKDLVASIDAGHIGGAALDVFCEEPPKDYTLFSHPKIVATPHLGANTVEAQIKVATEIAEQFVDYSEGKPLVGVVNPAVLN